MQEVEKELSRLISEVGYTPVKELFAKLIHYHGKRQNKPFVAINCAGIPENLMESEINKIYYPL